MTDDLTRTRKWWKPRISHVWLALLVLVIAWFAFFRIGLKSQLRTRLEAIRSAGYPATGAELNDWYAIPEGAENAAYIIMEAFSFYPEGDPEERKSLPIVGQGELPARTEPLAEEIKTLITAYLADNRQAIRLLHEASAFEHCRYPVDFRKGLDVKIPYLSEVKRCVKLLELDAVLFAENGQVEQAVRSLESASALARSLSKEPLLISQLVRIGCQVLVVSGLERVVNRTELGDEQLAGLERMLTDTQDLAAMSRAITGERCQVIEVFRGSARGIFGAMGGRAPPAPLLALYRAAGLSDKDALIYLDFMDGFIKAGALPLHLRQEAADAVEQKVEEISKIHVFARILAPAFARVFTIELKAVARLRAAAAGLAVQRYRLAEGALPESLAELVPKYLDTVPKDPFDGDDMRYVKLTNGFVVYSVGEDLSDDGAKEKPPRTKGRRKRGYYDITFIVERLLHKSGSDH
jgi:hypothetical protein